MSHGDRIEACRMVFGALGASSGSPFAVIADEGRRIYGLQFHPEVHHTPNGRSILQNFALKVCRLKRNGHPRRSSAMHTAAIQAQVGSGKVLAAVSGGVDSSVAAALVSEPSAAS